MRAEKFFGCLVAATMVLAIVSCAPIVRREGPAGGSGGSGSGGSDPMGGTTAMGGESGSGGSVDTGGTTDTGGVTETGGAPDTGGTTSLGGTTGSGGATGTGGGSGGTTGGGLGGTTSNICGLASSYGWASTQALMDPVSDGSHSLVGVKAPSAVFYGGKYHVFATVIDSTGAASMEHVQFADWSNAGSATVDYLDNNPGFKGACSQPQVFYLSGKKLWYLISQGPAPSYSTNADLSQTSGWSQPANFYSATPTIVTQNAGSGTPWTDFWVICNASDCYLFFTNTIGYLFRAKTSLGSFPSGFGDPVVVKQSETSFAGGPRVYKVDGSTGGYLMLVEGKGSGGRYIGAWSATAHRRRLRLLEAPGRYRGQSLRRRRRTPPTSKSRGPRTSATAS